ncbi:alpha/beta fold hydrolase [Subtercola boreus]|uniref:alpha/beta fold hydrolase n=1 Tax=Subtercola boreus TaxID=120213 RepID=UPI001559103D|nr:alpha/beta hydrolase [Subtercola boreus]
MTRHSPVPHRRDTHPGSVADYGHFGIVTDAWALGLHTSVVPTPIGAVTVRHSRHRVRRDAVAVVMLHGAAGSWSTFTPLLLTAFAEGVDLPDLVIPDLPGWGESSLPAAPADRSIESIAAAVASVVRALGYDRWMLIGHSLGGFVALELAVAEPAATQRVLLVSPTTFGVAETARHPLRRFGALPAYSGMLVAMRTLARMGRAGTALVGGIGASRFFRLTMSPLFAEPARIDRSVYLALAQEARPQSFAIASRRAGAYELTRWAGIRCPVRSVQGDADVFVAPGDQAQLASLVPDFEGGTVEGVGHFGHLERPVEVLRRLVLPALVSA